MLKRLPVGIEDFSEFFTEHFYYVDKTGFILDLLQNFGKVNLFTRPRRFGKTLTMSMLKSFFEIGCDTTLFDGLEVMKEKELCEEYMGKFPIISITLKGVEGYNFSMARYALANVIRNEAMRFQFLSESEKLSTREKEDYEKLLDLSSMPDTSDADRGVSAVGSSVLTTSLQTLSRLLSKHYGRKVVLLIDEYDVPLDKAFQAGYYDEMISLIRSLFNNVLKTNDSLQFAVMTGCLRISKESIFTGLNNLRVNTVVDTMCDEYFGFTDDEVKELLAYYGLSGHYEIVKDWYDGYQFGEASVYCPWDVINYCYDARMTKQLYPANYWANTSGNGMVRLFIDKSDKKTRDEIEQLIAGETILKEVRQELTYRELDSTIENLWSVLFTTGYLTQHGREDAWYRLAIPNLEIRDLFVREIREWFKETSKKDNAAIAGFCEAFLKKDTELIEKQLNRYLWNSISIRDASARKSLKENFYHGMLLGILQYEEEWLVKSNEESGNGYGDILIETPDRIGVVIELKYAENGNLEEQCKKALEQMTEKQYEARLLDDGMEMILKYGIAFYKKKCKVVSTK